MDNPLTNQNQVEILSKKKWKWSILWSSIKTSLFAEIEEGQKRNELDYFQYWYREILEEDLKKRKEKSGFC